MANKKPKRNKPAWGNAEWGHSEWAKRKPVKKPLNAGIIKALYWGKPLNAL